MIFPTIAQSLAKGERVGIASPRVDVILELAPRLRAVLDQPLALLYGKAEEGYLYRQVTLCTTHQLLRFYHAFDLLVVDEVDSFPFAMDPGLQYACQQAIKVDGGLLYLTATPGRDLLAANRRGELSISYLARRFHNHPLPEIQLVLVPTWRARLRQGSLPRQVVAWVRDRVSRKQEFLLFVPHVSDLALVERALKREGLSGFATVHAADPAREEKVQRMRAHGYRFLVTTTILERGVTLPKIDVGILGGDEATFSTAALVQIAGRVGRAKDRPGGDVTCWVAEWTRTVKEACQQIRFMNKKGGF